MICVNQNKMTHYSVLAIYQQYQTIIDEKQEIVVKGWIRTIRNQKDTTFLSINDGSTIKNVQVVFDNSILSEHQSTDLTYGASVIIKGMLVQSPSPSQQFELTVSSGENICVCGSIVGTNPLPSKGKITLEYLRSIPEIDKNYGSDYKWDSVARRVNKKLKVITGLSYGK